MKEVEVKKTDTAGAPQLPKIQVKLDASDCEAIDRIMINRTAADDLLAEMFERFQAMRAKNKEDEREWWRHVFSKYGLAARAPDHHWGYDERERTLTAIKANTDVEAALAGLNIVR